MSQIGVDGGSSQPSHLNHASKTLILLRDKNIVCHEELPILIHPEKLRLRAGEMALAR